MNQPENHMQLLNDQIEELLGSLVQSLPVPLDELPPPFRQLLDDTISSARAGDLEPLLNFADSIQQIMEGDDDEPMTPEDRFPLSSTAAAMILNGGDFDDDADPILLTAIATKALTEDPQSVEALVVLGQHASSHDQKLEYFRQACDAVGTKDPEDVAYAMPVNRLNMAVDLCGDGHWVDAATILLPALRESPFDSCEARYLLTELLLRLGWDDELEEIINAYDDEVVGPIPLAKAILKFKHEGASRRSNALLHLAFEQQIEVINALQHTVRPDQYGHMSQAEYVAQFLLPGIRGIPGAKAWIRETAQAMNDHSASDSDMFDDEETRHAERDPLGFAIQLKPTDEKWFLVVAKAEDMFVAVVLTEEMGLVQLETFADRPKTVELRTLLQSAITDPIFGNRRKPKTLLVATKAHVTAVSKHCGTFDIALKQQKSSAELSKMIKTVMDGYIRQQQQPDCTDQESTIDVQSLPMCDETWLFAIFQPPLWIHDRATPWRPWMYLVQRASDGVILRTESLDEKPTVQAACYAIQLAMANPLIDKPRRPAEIFCDPSIPIPVSELQTSLAAEDTVIQIGEETLHDFFNKVVCDMLEFNAPVKGSLLGQDDVDGAFLSAFYKEAARFYKAAPWKMVPGDRIFEIRCETWENPLWSGCVIGQLGQELGLALYDNPDAANEFMSSQDPSMMNAVTIHFVEAFDTIQQDQWHLERNRWTVASDEAYPFVSRVQNGKDFVCPSAADLTALYETMRHTTRFLDHPASKPLVVKTIDGETITFRWSR